MAWFYKIRDCKGTVVGNGGGFATEKATYDAGEEEKARLKRTGNLPNNCNATVEVGEDSTEPWQ